MTKFDMTRISNNLNYLADLLEEHQMYHGRHLDKETWDWNDYVTRADWTKILAVLRDVVVALGMENPEEATYSTNYDNINIVETFTQRARDRFEQYMGMGDIGKFVDTEVWAGDDYNLGGIQDPWESPYKRIAHYTAESPIGFYVNDFGLNTGGVD